MSHDLLDVPTLALTGGSHRTQTLLFRLSLRAALLEGRIYVAYEAQNPYKSISVAVLFGPGASFLGR